MAERSIAGHTGVFEQLHAIKSNDGRALKNLYQANFSKVESFVLNNNGNEEQAKDIFQEAFIAVWRNIQMDKFQPQNETAIDGYLFQIAKNKWMDHLRSGHYTKVVRIKKEHIPEPEIETMADNETEYLDAVKKHFKDLGDNCKQILTLFYYDNESMKNIADKMGWTEATAKNNKYRCIQKLKELINK